MLVYRLEDDKQYGAFSKQGRTGFSPGLDVTGNSPSRHPTPNMEGMKYTENHYCGFKSISQLRRWFNKKQRAEIKRFAPMFNISVYEVPTEEVIFGKFQVMFELHGENTKLIERICPTSI